MNLQLALLLAVAVLAFGVELPADASKWVTFAWVFPVKWMAQGMRSSLLPDEFEVVEVSGSWQHGLTVLVLGAWIVLGLIFATRTFRWMHRDDG